MTFVVPGGSTKDRFCAPHQHPVTNTSVNPARSTAPALFAGMAHIQQLWLFWLAPLVGAALGDLVYRTMLEREIEPPVAGGPSSREVFR